jgi:hypothetical protein
VHHIDDAFGIEKSPRSQMDAIPEEDPIQILTLALETDDAAVRQKAARGLAQIGHSHEIVVPALIRALPDRDPLVRLSVSNALGRIGQPAVPFLVDALNTEDTELRRLVVVTLGRLGPKAKVAVPFLVDLQENEAIALEVAEALARIQRGRRAYWDRLGQAGLSWGLYLLVVLLVGIGVWLWLRENLPQPVQGVGAATAAAWAVIGATVGVLIGLSKHGRWGALAAATLFGCGGAVTGMIVGTIFGTIFQTVAAVLAQPEKLPQ